MEMVEIESPPARFPRPSSKTGAETATAGAAGAPAVPCCPPRRAGRWRTAARAPIILRSRGLCGRRECVLRVRCWPPRCALGSDLARGGRGAGRGSLLCGIAGSRAGAAGVDAPRVAQSRRGAPDFRGPRHMADRERGRGEDRNRLQRLHPASGGARYRHHEPGPHHPLLARSRSRHQACAARLEPGRRRGQARSDRSPTCACATWRPTSATGPAARSPTAIPSSFSRSRACASATSATCITR